MKTILYIAPGPATKGGISTVVKDYLSSSYLTEKYHILYICSHRDGYRAVKFLQAILGIFATFRHLFLKRVDIVHIHGGDILSFLRKLVFMKLARLFHCKVIYHHHGAAFMHYYRTAPFILQRAISAAFETVDLVICLSESWKTEIQTISPKAAIQVLPNAVRIPRAYIRHSNAHVNLSFLGLIGQRKGVFDLLIVLKKLLEHGIKVKLNIAGNGDVHGLFKQAQRLGILDHISYLGWLNDAQKHSLLQKTDIFVLPSYAEGVPMSILEAMSYSLPIVTTSVGGIPELVTDGETGLLVAPGDLQALYEALAYLIKNPSRRSAFGRKALIHVREKYNLEHKVKELATIYEDVMAGVAYCNYKNELSRARL